jgi:hypothetical protein
MIILKPEIRIPLAGIFLAGVVVSLFQCKDDIFGDNE